MPLRSGLNGAAIVTRNHSDTNNNNINYCYHVCSMPGTILIPNIYTSGSLQMAAVIIS